MTLLSILKTNLSAIGAILAVMAAVALLETAVPLHARGRWHRTHVGPNPRSDLHHVRWSAVNGLLEHANIRVPRRLDSALSL